ncbi:hypothetical protein BAE44_0021288 [Dichanthelium oligosanthes]|uniref:CCT domain-containing protein n=1 Tax=Dichanthelium oligosanthes TaxID=888268 RepID=A0A1E5UXS4_9POAL|nr:hypothetical protein BAE44_0021288 [Dichanthelium oligosanthes]
MDLDDDDDVPYCAYCSTLRALIHCAQHATRLCLPCDVRVHAAVPDHARAPLCHGCYAEPAAAHCAVHRASLCAPCARDSGCDAERHARRLARAYVGFPPAAELARILACDTTPPPPLPEPTADTWVPDLVNIELLPDLPNSSSSSWHDGNNITNTNEAPSSLMDDYHHQLIEPCSEPIIASTDAVLESMASNNAAHRQLSSVVATANTSSNVGSSSELLPHGNTLYVSGMPTLPPGEFPSGHFGFEVKPPGLQATSAPEQPSGQEMEARMKQQEKRQEAKQRYKDKKKNRKFGKQIMYVSRKVRADTRNRVKGRFAKASSGGDHGDDQSTQQGDDEPTQQGDDQPTNS